MTLGPVMDGLLAVLSSEAHQHFEALVGEPGMLNLRCFSSSDKRAIQGPHLTMSCRLSR